MDEERRTQEESVAGEADLDGDVVAAHVVEEAGRVGLEGQPHPVADPPSPRHLHRLRDVPAPQRQRGQKACR